MSVVSIRFCKENTTKGDEITLYLKLPGNGHILLLDLLVPVVPGQYLLLKISMILGFEVLVGMISDCILDTFLYTLILLKPSKR